MKPNNRFKRVVGEEFESVLRYCATHYIRGWDNYHVRSWRRQPSKWQSKHKKRKPSKDSIRKPE